MKSIQSIACFVALLVSSSLTAQERPTGWQNLFDGETLTGWDGDPKFWSVKDGAITGTTTKEVPAQGNTFIIYVGENKDNAPVDFADFELKLEFRILEHNSGIQYRSFKANGSDRWRVGGYQADFDKGKGWTGTNYGERFRGLLAKRGEKVTIRNEEIEKDGRKKTVTKRDVEPLEGATDLVKKIKDAPDWNEYHIIANGFHFIQKINDVTMSEFIDNDPQHREKGLIAVQLHAGPPMTVQVKNVRIKVLEAK
ncbi:MAG: DUF1080 domain-containing protein [Planctomycetota bacterium]|nr:DUF1080 domain-containing protein [Planctomycetota bacterium]MDA1138771.1 DUF1080 domain-containing protein [Planctomycetota bacterium]